MNLRYPHTTKYMAGGAVEAESDIDLVASLVGGVLDSSSRLAGAAARELAARGTVTDPSGVSWVADTARHLLADVELDQRLLAVLPEDVAATAVRFFEAADRDRHTVLLNRHVEPAAVLAAAINGLVSAESAVDALDRLRQAGADLRAALAATGADGAGIDEVVDRAAHVDPALPLGHQIVGWAYRTDARGLYRQFCDRWFRGPIDPGVARYVIRHLSTVQVAEALDVPPLFGHTVLRSVVGVGADLCRYDGETVDPGASAAAGVHDVVAQAVGLESDVLYGRFVAYEQRQLDVAVRQGDIDWRDLAVTEDGGLAPEVVLDSLEQAPDDVLADVLSGHGPGHPGSVLRWLVTCETLHRQAGETAAVRGWRQPTSSRARKSAIGAVALLAGISRVKAASVVDDGAMHHVPDGATGRVIALLEAYSRFDRPADVELVAALLSASPEVDTVAEDTVTGNLVVLLEGGGVTHVSSPASVTVDGQSRDTDVSASSPDPLRVARAILRTSGV